MTQTEQAQVDGLHDQWREFGHVAKIQGWIEELKNAKDSPITAYDWRLMGRAVMICHPIEELREPLVKKIADEAGYEYIRFSGEAFFELVRERKPIPGSTPAIIHVEQCAWSGKIEDDKKAAKELSDFQKIGLPNYLAELPNDLLVIFVVTGKSYVDLNPALRTVGTFDRRFDIAKPTLDELGIWFLNNIGTHLCDDSLLADAGKVGKLIDNEFEARRRQKLIALQMQRLAKREERLLSFDDLVYFAVHGGSETEHKQDEDSATLHRIAVHEAGHALVSIIDSDGRNMPDYTSIMPGAHFKGIVADSYAYSYALTGRYTYEDSRHKIRTQLAGRIAEAVVFGTTKVSTFSARSDLSNATAWAKELVGICGFSAEHENPDAIRDNLAVIDDEATPSEAAHIEQQTRLFLKRQYEAVELMILENKPFLDAITHALLEKQVLYQSDMSTIFRDILRGDAQTPLADRTSKFTAINPLLTKIVEHITGEYTLEAQGISRSQLANLSDSTRDQLHSCIKKHLLLHKHGVAIYALTKSPLLYAANLLAIFSDLSLDQLIDSKALTDSEFQSVSLALGKLHEASVHFDDTHGLSSDKRLEGLFRLEQTMGITKLGAIICDRDDLLDERFKEYCLKQGIEIVILNLNASD